MRQLILHIGQPKTGTTTLQSSLQASREALLRHGVLYPRTVSGNNHRIAKTHLCGGGVPSKTDLRRHGGNVEKIKEEAQTAYQLIVEDIAEHKPDVMVLSAEGFFSAGRQEGFFTFIEQLNAWADEVIAVAYIRAPAPLYLSRVQQNLRWSGFEMPGTQKLNYRVSLEPYLRSDKIKLAVHEFDRAALIDGDVVEDFKSRYLSKAAASAVKTLDDNQNTSISPEAMAVYEDIYTGKIVAKGQESGTITRKLSTLVRSYDNELAGKSRPAYKPGIARVVYDAEPDMDWVRDTFGIDFEKPQSHPDASGLNAEDLSNVRAICHVNEVRYQQLFQTVAQSQTSFAAFETGPLRVLRPALPAIKAIRRSPVVKRLRSGFWKIMRPIRKNVFAKKLRGLLRRSHR